MNESMADLTEQEREIMDNKILQLQNNGKRHEAAEREASEKAD